MKKSVADKWVAALRSGKYKQGVHNLRSLDDKYCCLGVLCEISGVKSKATGDGYYYEGNGYRLTDKVQKLTGVKSEYGNLGDDDIKLSDLNDQGVQNVGRLTFDEIADIIQICYEEL